jgi:hypothetical protein
MRKRIGRRSLGHAMARLLLRQPFGSLPSHFAEVDMTQPIENEPSTWRVPVMKLLLIFMAFAQLVDVLSTNRALAAAGDRLYEANPVMGYSMETLGSFWWLPKCAIAIVLMLLAIRLKRATLREFVLATLVEFAYLGVLVNNFIR